MALLVISDHDVGNPSNRVSHQYVDQKRQEAASEHDHGTVLFTCSVHAPKRHLWQYMIIELQNFSSIDYTKGTEDDYHY